MSTDLHPDEHVVFHGHPSWRGMLGLYLRGIFGALAAGATAALVTRISAGHVQWGWAILVAAGLTALVLLVVLLARISTTYTITSQRLTIRRGILSRHVQETRIERVQNVNTNQTLLDRLLRVGRVDFDTAGSDDFEFAFSGVADPAEVVRAVDRAHRELEQTQQATSRSGV